jgi:23S rRNA (uracil1939-C5)-methyltransferase
VTIPPHTLSPLPHTRYVSGRYRVRVEALAANGESVGGVIAVLAAPSDAEFAEVYGPKFEPAQRPETFTFVGGLPDEVVEVEAFWSLPRLGRKRAKRVPPPVVRVAAVIEPSPDRITPKCAVFGVCGGCQLQHLAYAAQLTWKTERVRAALAVEGFADPLVAPALGCEPPWHYRNHMRFSVNRDGRAGLTARGSHRVLPLRDCPIAQPQINDALEAFARTTLPQPQALLRYSAATGQMLLQPPPAPEVRAELEALGLELREADLDEGLGGHLFRIRPSSFFQTNTRQAEHMARLVLAQVPTGPDAALVDAYCGVGVFARLLAAHAGRVVAVEESASAVRDARWNLRDVPHVEIVQAKVEEWLPAVTERLDALVIDPPRAGCQKPVLDALIARRVPRIVYVSCGPDTLARDLAYLCLRHEAYRLVSVQPLDMFPQTAHIENIATLEVVS